MGECAKVRLLKSFLLPTVKRGVGCFLLIVSHNIIVMWYHTAVRLPARPLEIRPASLLLSVLLAASVFVCFRSYSLLFSFILVYSVLIASTQSALVIVGAAVFNIIIKYVFSGQGFPRRG